jgi:ABC-type protease/lipase transport system fused ATPase/permease subunit
VVVITHRKGLLAAADQLLVLADGRPKLFGPRDQVLAKISPAPAAPAAPPVEAA